MSKVVYRAVALMLRLECGHIAFTDNPIEGIPSITEGQDVYCCTCVEIKASIDNAIAAQWTPMSEGPPKEEGWYVYEYMRHDELDYKTDYFFPHLGDNNWKNPIRWQPINPPKKVK